MRVLVFEPDYKGHRLTYLRRILPELAALANRVIVVLDHDAPASLEYKEQLAGIRDHFELDASVKPGVRFKGMKLAEWNLDVLGRVIDRHKPDHVYLPMADGITQLAGMRALYGRRTIAKGLECEALLFHGRIGYSGLSMADRLKNQIAWLTLPHSPWSRIFFSGPAGT